MDRKKHRKETKKKKLLSCNARSLRSADYCHKKEEKETQKKQVAGRMPEMKIQSAIKKKERKRRNEERNREKRQKRNEKKKLLSCGASLLRIAD